MMTMPSREIRADSVRAEECQYVRVGPDFPGRVADLLCRNESVVLLGPRYVGKRYVLSEVKRRLRTAGDTHILPLRLAEEQAWQDQSFLPPVIGEMIGTCLAGFGWQPPAE